MQSIATDILNQIASNAYAPIIALKFESWGGNTVGYVRWPATLPYGAVTYVPRLFGIDDVQASQERGTISMSLWLDNSDAMISAACAAYSPKNAMVTLYRLIEGDSVNAQILLQGMSVESYKIGGTTATFTLGITTAHRRQRVPARVCSRNCAWTWKDENCMYDGAVLTACDHTLKSCTLVYENNVNFGGIPPAVPVRS